MSVPGGGVVEPVKYPMMWCWPNNWQTDTFENITFPKQTNKFLNVYEYHGMYRYRYAISDAGVSPNCAVTCTSSLS